MDNNTFSSKRILGNTVALYIRSMFSLVLNLIISRQLLKVLGVEDYGIYSVVGSFIVLFGFLNSTMGASAQRFLNYEMGLSKDGKGNVKNVFSNIINIQIIISIVIFILCETIGVYLFYNYLNIPPARSHAAFVCLQFSILTLIINTLTIPYYGLLIAFENMKAFAYLDICGYILNLCIVLTLPLISSDRLIIYATLFFCAQLLVRLGYYVYCRYKYSDSKYKYGIDKVLTRQILSFFSWTTLSGISILIIMQGIGILYNVFYGVLVSAAIGIANQVNGAVQNLCNNFVTSLFPQITKSYAQGDYEKVRELHFTGTKMAYILLSFFAVPIIIDVNEILAIWLGTPPKYANLFIIMLMINQLMYFFGINTNTLVRASGKVKVFEITQNGIFFAFFFLLWVLFYLKVPIYMPYLIYSLAAFVISIYKAYYSCKVIHIKFREYFNEIYLRLIPFIFVSLALSYVVRLHEMNFLILLLHCIATGLIICLMAGVIVLNKRERVYLQSLCSKIIQKCK